MDNVNHPAHYNSGGIECIQAMRSAMSSEEFNGFCKGNVMKYIWRASHKGTYVEDLKKAKEYLEFWIANLQNEQNVDGKEKKTNE